MKGKIGLEEHFAIRRHAERFERVLSRMWGEVREPRLTDLQDKRLRLMDEFGMEIMILSLNAPACRPSRREEGQRGGARGKRLSRRARSRSGRTASGVLPRWRCRTRTMAAQRADALREGTRLCRRAGERLFAGRRCRQRALLRPAAILAVLAHRRRRSTCRSICIRAIRCRATIRAYEGHDWLLGPNWAFHAETAVHALRLIGSGLFDEYPKLQIILGHLGEGIPAYLWRIDNRNAWMKAPHKYAAKKWVADYVRNNFVLTTSGNFSTSALTRRSPRSASSACCGRPTIRSRTSAMRPTGSTPPAQRGGPDQDRAHQRAEAVQAEDVNRRTG